MTEREKMQEEMERHWRNMLQMDEFTCRQRRVSGFPCSKEICSYFGTPRCVHPEQAGFPVNRY